MSDEESYYDDKSLFKISEESNYSFKKKRKESYSNKAGTLFHY